MDGKLKPCPFCGSTNLRIEQLILDCVVGDGVYWVWCLGCDIESPCRSSEAKAIEYWNTRVGTNA